MRKYTGPIALLIGQGALIAAVLQLRGADVGDWVIGLAIAGQIVLVVAALLGVAGIDGLTRLVAAVSRKDGKGGPVEPPSADQ